MTYVCKWGKGSRLLVATSEEVRVRYRQKHRATGRTLGGLFTEVESAGYDKSTVEVSMVDAKSDVGMKRTISYGSIPLSKAREHIRELSAKDAARLAEYDQEIEEWAEHVRRMRMERKTFLRRAFGRGSAVLPGTLKEMAEAKP